MASARWQRGRNDPGQWIVWTAPSLGPALEPLIEHRRKEGFNVTVLETTKSLTKEQVRQNDGTALQNRIAALCKDTEAPNYVLLAGGMIPPGTNDTGKLLFRL